MEVKNYRIAVASSDGVHVDQSFGETSEFRIYVVEADGSYYEEEIRKVEKNFQDHVNKKPEDCATASCGSGGHGCGTGCGGDPEAVTIFSDCRCVICTRIGFKACKNLERRTIGAFDIEGEVVEILAKIIQYYKRVDSHQSLRGIAHEQ